MKYPEPYHGCVEMQRLILNDARKPELKPVIRAAIARAYCDLEETKRKLRMKPLPKSVDVTKYQSRSREQRAILKESLSVAGPVTAGPPVGGEIGRGDLYDTPSLDSGATLDDSNGAGADGHGGGNGEVAG